VAGIHLALIIVLGSSACIRRYFRPPPETVIPVEFMVEVPVAESAVLVHEAEPAVPEPPPPEPPPPEPPPPEPAVPEPEPVPTPEPSPPRPLRPPIETSRERVTRVTGQTPAEQRPTLTPEQIERMLAEGARAGDRTVVPGEDQRILARIREILHAAWQQPSAAEAGGREAVLTLVLDARGRIVSGRLARPSGSDALDASVRDVLGRVHEIPGITADFVRRYPQVNVAFQVR